MDSDYKENPEKTKLKQLYLRQYGVKLGIFPNHIEKLPKFRPKIRNISIKELNHLVKPELARQRTRSLNEKVHTAHFLNKITQMQYFQENYDLPPLQKKQRSKTELRIEHKKARSSYLIVT